MALEGTHIKLALDVKEKYGITDLAKYIAGTVYPDSRYLTKVERKLTHFEVNLDEISSMDDFKKGWVVHLLTDLYLKEVIKERFSNVFERLTLTTWGSEFWVRRTAIKNLLDIEIVNSFDIQPYLPMLDETVAANGEPQEKITAYNQTVNDLYKNKTVIGVADIEKLWFDWGVSGQLLKDVTQRTEQFQADENIMKEIKNLYQLLLNKFN